MSGEDLEWIQKTLQLSNVKPKIRVCHSVAIVIRNAMYVECFLVACICHIIIILYVLLWLKHRGVTVWCGDLNSWPVWVRYVPQWWCSEASELHEWTPLCTASRTIQTELSQKAKWLICEQEKHHMRNAQMPHLTACQYTVHRLQLVEKPTPWIFYLQLTSTQLHNFEFTPCLWRQWSCPLSLAKLFQLFQSYCVHYCFDVYSVYYDARLGS